MRAVFVRAARKLLRLPLPVDAVRSEQNLPHPTAAASAAVVHHPGCSIPGRGHPQPCPFRTCKSSARHVNSATQMGNNVATRWHAHDVSTKGCLAFRLQICATEVQRRSALDIDTIRLLCSDQPVVIPNSYLIVSARARRATTPLLYLWPATASGTHPAVAKRGASFALLAWRRCGAAAQPAAQLAAFPKAGEESQACQSQARLDGPKPGLMAGVEVAATPALFQRGTAA